MQHNVVNARVNGMWQLDIHQQGVRDRDYPAPNEYTHLNYVDEKINSSRLSTAEGRKFTSPKYGSLNR